jgi:alkanesulfonate monooxygenase SsuD/methylene tetrahydromethanopterin reductase-like flavin-dependent oxidoreductase (luciferase family)
MKVYSFHLMPYAELDMGHRKTHNSVWLKLPNAYFDPEVGHRLYNRYLDELELAAELGFDGICVNEHHQNAYGLMPSPIVTASALARRTTDCKIAILGSAFALREHPLTLAEEHAMIDCISGGRVISGFVRGVGAEYFAMGVNPAFSRERHEEAHDLVVRAWTEPGPFAFEGKHYHFEYVNVWPRPYQKPHPPIWCPSMGSAETIDWAAHPDRKYTYLQAFTPFESTLRAHDNFRETAQTRYGYVASSEQIGWAIPIYVGETDERARVEAAPHFEAMFNVFLPKISQAMFSPPGYVTTESYRRFLAHNRTVRGDIDFAELVERGVIICGGPDTVRRRIAECHHLAGFQHFMGLFQFGTMPADLSERNLRRFSQEVMPAIQALGDDAYRGYEPGVVAAQ